MKSEEWIRERLYNLKEFKRYCSEDYKKEVEGKIYELELILEDNNE